MSYNRRNIASAGQILALIITLGFISSFTSAQNVLHQEGDCVVVEGYIMDEFCINRGTLFDNPTQPTLIAPGPEVHSIHCLVDVPACINSGYTVLEDNGDDTFSVAYRFDDVGDALVKQLAIQSGAAGACDECDGSEGGTATAGFRATIVGRVTQLGDPLSSNAVNQAPTLQVSQVLPSGVALMGLECSEPEPEPEPEPQVGDCVCTEGYIMDEFCINRGTLFDNPTQETLVAPGPEVHSLHCLVDVPQCIASGYTVLADNGDDTFSVGYRFDDIGDSMMLDFAIQSGAAGACDECDVAFGGTVTAGFRATVIGTVVELGDALAPQPLGKAHTLSVGQILPSEMGCVNFDTSLCPAVVEDVDEEDTATGGPVTLTLSEEPRVVVEYEVLTPENTQGLTAQAIAAGGVLDVTLIYEHEGWVAFGISPDQTMVNSETIISVFPNIPEKYLISQYAETGIARRPDNEQTLIGASITQENGVTVMKFQKLLREEGEYELVVGEENNFIWAVGNENVLAYHRVRSFFTASLEAGTSVSLGSLLPPNKALWKFHGTLAILAWGVLAPLAIGSSLCRDLIPGHGVWFKIHFYLNFTCVMFTIVFFATAIAGTEKAALEHFNGTHQRVGLSVLVISLSQVLAGLFRPHAPSSDANVTPDDDADIETNDDNRQEQPKQEVKKTPARLAFEIGHRLLGATLLGLAFFNIDEGLKLFAARYNNTQDYTVVFWVWISVVLTLIVCGTVYSKSLSKQK